jgi:hypothetical protein
MLSNLKLVLLLLACFTSLAAFAQDDNPATPTPEEKQILDLTNDARADQGLGPLKWDPALAAAAAQHNRLMRGQSDLSHQYSGEPALVDRAAHSGAHFSSIAENIAVGPSPGAIEREWLHSAPHRANIFDPRMDSIGISVVRRGGDMFATADFARAVASSGPEQVEGQVAALLQKQNLTVNTDPNYVRDARETCEMSSGSAGGTQAKFIMRWESSAMTQLPDQLTQQTATGKFKSAAVGSCTSAHPQQGFTTYRVAVLLY